MKSKNAPQTLLYPLLKYIPVLMALGILGLWSWLMIETYGFPDPDRSVVVFYPLIQLKLTRYSTILIGMLCIVTLLTLVFIFQVGLRRLLDNLWFALIVLGVVGAIGIGHISSGRAFQEIETFSTNGHLYRLVQTGGLQWGYSTYIKAYTVLECDAGGEWCRRVSTPYLKDGFCECFETDEHLKTDPDSGRLLLFVGQDIIDVEATDILKICSDLRVEQEKSWPEKVENRGYVCAS
jgi:hypothetical protein